MVNCYLDTSALLKQYVDEVGSSWLRAQILQADLLATTQLLIVEIISAFNRRLREHSLTLEEYRRLRDIFCEDCRISYQIIAPTSSIVDLAGELLERRSLRAYDAMHLATALTAQHSLLTRRLPGFAFLSADDHLLAAAAAEGLAVDNPNHHP